MSTNKEKEVKNLEKNKEGEIYTRSDNIIFFDGVSYSNHGSSNETVANLVFNLLEARDNNRKKEEELKKEELSAQIVSNSKNSK